MSTPGVEPPSSRASIAATQAERKRHALAQAKRAPFFHGKLDHIDPTRLDDPNEWAKIPILDKEALRALSDTEFYQGFCVPPRDGDVVLEYWRSGGSTGRPLFYPRTRQDLRAAMSGFARVLTCAGADLTGCVHCSFPLGIHPAGQMMAKAAQELGMGVFMAGAGTNTPSALQLELISRFAPRAWMGMSSYGLHLAALADQLDIELAKSATDLLICSAEPLSKAKREKLERLWGARVRDSFGMTEAGMMGAEDGQADGFRIWSDLFFVEVVDPDTLAPVPDGETGGLVVTPLYTNNTTPFLRWYSGDLVTLDSEPRGNGAFSVFPVLRHAHRTAGFFKIRGVNIGHTDFEDFMFRIEAVSDFKCEALAAGDQDQLRVSIELARGADADAAVTRLRTEVKRAFEVTPDVVVLEPGALAREFEATVKAMRMIDRRSPQT